jgi:hypothetical protein
MDRNGTTKDERGYSSAKPSSGNVSGKANGGRDVGDNYFNLFNPNENNARGGEKKAIVMFDLKIY